MRRKKMKDYKAYEDDREVYGINCWFKLRRLPQKLFKFRTSSYLFNYNILSNELKNQRSVFVAHAVGLFIRTFGDY